MISADELRKTYSLDSFLGPLESHLIACASLGHLSTTLGCESNSDYHKDYTVWMAGKTSQLWRSLKNILIDLGYDVSYCPATARTKISW